VFKPVSDLALRGHAIIIGMTLDNPVISSLSPVILLILVGFMAGRAGWVRGESVRDLTHLVFLVLSQALLFRTMSSVHLDKLALRPIFEYFALAAALFLVMLFIYGRDSRASVLALASIFSNTLMIGVPLVGLAFGEPGQVLLFTLISLHALVLLTFVTVVLELQMAHEQVQAGGASRHMLRTVGLAMRNAIIHPVPLPILAGLLYAQTGWGLHPVIDKPLMLLGSAFGPVALVLVGITLAHAKVGYQFANALKISIVKTVVHPVLMVSAGWLLGMRGLHLSVMVVAASLPVGANVFLFSQRYQKEEDVVTSSMALSTAMALISVSVVMALLPLLPA